MTSADLARCEELFTLLKWSTPCLAQGDQTWCHEPRGNRVLKELRGTMLPKEIWCGNCKNRLRGQQLIEEIRNAGK